MLVEAANIKNSFKAIQWKGFRKNQNQIRPWIKQQINKKQWVKPPIKSPFKTIVGEGTGLIACRRDFHGITTTFEEALIELCSHPPKKPRTSEGGDKIVPNPLVSLLSK